MIMNRAVAVVRWCFAGCLLENFCKIMLIIEAKLIRDLFDRQMRMIEQQIFCIRDFIVNNVCDRCAMESRMKITDQLLFGYITVFCKVIQRNFFSIMTSDIENRFF